MPSESLLNRGVECDAKEYPDRIGRDVGPGEGGAEDQVSRSGAADGVDPRGLIQLRELDQARCREGERGDGSRGGLGFAEGPTEENHQGPESVSRIFPNERGQCRRKLSGGETEEDDQDESPADPCPATPYTLVMHEGLGDPHPIPAVKTANSAAGTSSAWGDGPPGLRG